MNRRGIPSLRHRPPPPQCPCLSSLFLFPVFLSTALPLSTMVYRPNPFFATTNSFFVPSVGDKVDGAIADVKAFGQDAQAKANELTGKADLKLQDAKEAVKQSATSAPTGADLYARYVTFPLQTVATFFCWLSIAC